MCYHVECQSITCPQIFINSNPASQVVSLSILALNQDFLHKLENRYDHIVWIDTASVDTWQRSILIKKKRKLQIRSTLSETGTRRSNHPSQHPLPLLHTAPEIRLFDKPHILRLTFPLGKLRFKFILENQHRNNLIHLQ